MDGSFSLSSSYWYAGLALQGQLLNQHLNASVHKYPDTAQLHEHEGSCDDSDDDSNNSIDDDFGGGVHLNIHMFLAS